MQNQMSLPDTKITSPTAAISDRFKKAEYFGLKGRFSAGRITQEQF